MEGLSFYKLFGTGSDEGFTFKFNPLTNSGVYAILAVWSDENNARSSVITSKIFQKYKKNIKLIIHCASQPSHDYGKNFPIIDFNVNATGTLNLLELTKKYCPSSPFIFMSTNKVYGDNPNKLRIIEKSKRWELKKDNKYYKAP